MPRRRYQPTTLFLIILSIAFIGAIWLQNDDSSRLVYEVVLESLGTKLPIREYSFYSLPSRCRINKLTDLPGVSKDLLENYFEKNNVLQREVPPFNITSTKDINIVTKDDTRKIYTDKQPDLKNIPDQIIGLSAIGFDSTKTQALLCVESAESGDLVHVQKYNSEWKVLKWHYIW